jgi:hypothetical protein
MAKAPSKSTKGVEATEGRMSKEEELAGKVAKVLAIILVFLLRSSVILIELLRVVVQLFYVQTWSAGLALYKLGWMPMGYLRFFRNFNYWVGFAPDLQVAKETGRIVKLADAESKLDFIRAEHDALVKQFGSGPLTSVNYRPRTVSFPAVSTVFSSPVEYLTELFLALHRYLARKWQNGRSTRRFRLSERKTQDLTRIARGCRKADRVFNKVFSLTLMIILCCEFTANAADLTISRTEDDLDGGTLAHDGDIKVTHNFVFHRVADVDVNPNYATLTRVVSLKKWYQTLELINSTIQAHKSVCGNYIEAVQNGVNPANMSLTLVDYTRQPAEMETTCKIQNLQLPEIKTVEDRRKLEEFMRQTNTIRTQAGIYMDRDHNFLFMSDDSNAETPELFPTLCGTSPWDIFKHKNYDKENIYFYQLVQNRIELCGGRPKTYKPIMRQLVCQMPEKARETSRAAYASAKANTNRCRKETVRMERELMNLKGMIDSFQAVKSGRITGIQADTGSRRVKRAWFSAVAAIVPSLLDFGTSIFSYFAERRSLENIRVQLKMHNEKFNEIILHNVELDNAVDAINQELPHIKSEIMRVEALANTYFVETQLRLMEDELQNSLYDSLQAFASALAMAEHGMTSDGLLPHGDKISIRNTLATEHGLRIHIENTAIMTFIDHDEEGVKLTYAFPIIDPTRQASIFRAYPRPSFLEGKKYWPQVESRFYAIMREGSYFATLGDDEALHCMKDVANCQVSKPLTPASKETACEMTEYFKKSGGCDYREAHDLNPFFMTLKNYTFYVVEKPTQAETHCPASKKAAAESYKTMTSAGHFPTRSGCYVEANGYRILPGNPVDKQAATINDGTIGTDGFGRPMTPFEEKERLNDIKSDIERARLRERDNSTHFTEFKKGNIKTISKKEADLSGIVDYQTLLEILMYGAIAFAAVIGIWIVYACIKRENACDCLPCGCHWRWKKVDRDDGKDDNGVPLQRMDNSRNNGRNSSGRSQARDLNTTRSTYVSYNLTDDQPHFTGPQYRDDDVMSRHSGSDFGMPSQLRSMDNVNLTENLLGNEYPSARPNTRRGTHPQYDVPPNGQTLREQGKSPHDFAKGPVIIQPSSNKPIATPRPVPPPSVPIGGARRKDNVQRVEISMNGGNKTATQGATGLLNQNVTMTNVGPET